MKNNIRTIADLTVENCHAVSLIVNRQHPEWDTKAFHYKGEGGSHYHTFGQGSNSAVLDEYEFKFWRVVKFREKFDKNPEYKFTYKNTDYKILEVPAISSGEVHNVFYGYQIESLLVSSVICYKSKAEAIARAEKIIDNPKLIEGMMSEKMFMPNEKWFK
jgi:hypothetical protein